MTDQLGIEKRLAISYAFCTIMGIITSVSTGIAWGHWYRTLDQCGIRRNCSCILYGQNTMSKFLGNILSCDKFQLYLSFIIIGGGQAPCIWVTFGPLLYVFFSLCMTCFHGYRVLFTTKSPKMRTRRTMLATMYM